MLIPTGPYAAGEMIGRPRQPLRMLSRARRTLLAFGLSASSMALSSAPSSAQMDSVPRFRLQAMAVAAQLETTVQYEFADGLIVTQVSFERNLGLDRFQVLPAFIASYRISGRHHVMSSYYDLRRSASKRIDIDVPLQDTTLSLGALVESHFSTRVFTLGYGYSLLQTPRHSVTPYVALYLTAWSAGVEVESSQRVPSSEVNLTAPLPMFGTAVRANVARRLSLGGNLGLFFVKVDKFDGAIIDFNVLASLRLHRALSLGLGYAWFNVDVHSARRAFTGGVRYRFHGPTVLATISF